MNKKINVGIIQVIRSFVPATKLFLQKGKPGKYADERD